MFGNFIYNLNPKEKINVSRNKIKVKHSLRCPNCSSSMRGIEAGACFALLCFNKTFLINLKTCDLLKSSVVSPFY
jgi:hypothetical protein